MADSPYRLLCTGDVHLGRRPSRVPLGDGSLRVAHVWGRIVDAALERAVNAVVLTGDIVDNENKMYEAFGALERGVRRLLDDGIDVVAVAGNHDHDAFPRLVRAIQSERFHLLGAGGRWSSTRLERENSGAIEFVGWSFPDATVPESPLKAFEGGRDGIPTIGVLHCDADQTEGRYAPVGRDMLAQQPVDAWLLGHIHEPSEQRVGDQLQLYVGSPQPLDPGEGGTHGAWQVDVAASGAVRAESLPLASLRYDTITVDVSDLEEPSAAETAVLQTLRTSLSEAVEHWPRLQHIAYRLRFEGRTRHRQALRTQGQKMMEDLQVTLDAASATVEAIELDTRPDYDLRTIAKGQDPPGVLAQLLLDLQAGRTDEERVAEALRRADKAVGEVHDASGYAPLRRDSETREPPSRDELRTKLIEQGLLLLDELHDRRG